MRGSVRLVCANDSSLPECRFRLARSSTHHLATVPLSISSGVFASFNANTPQRCAINLAARTAAPTNTDPNQSNNRADLPMDVVDLHDPGQTAILAVV